ncbi:MAG: hypothetical protein GEU90_21495 [Gemmatimonas sp.]|nr:hypothetical protein [Gemmatimonas sp.]
MILGALSESEYFDSHSGNDLRSISALALTYSPWFERNLSIGFARSVYAPVDGVAELAGHVIDVFMDVGRPNARPQSDLERDPDRDQIFSLFGRWILPRSGFETWFEWSRGEQPENVSDLLSTPQHTQGYTLGLQWARPVGRDSRFRLQGETTFLEGSHTWHSRRVISYYESRPVLQGYTHRGRVLGAAIGPGASSQWFAADLHAPTYEVGLFLGRIRWENDAFFDAQVAPFIFDHDVSVFGGVRGGYRLGWGHLDGEITLGQRFNYLFQNPSLELAAPKGVNIRNLTFTLRFQPTLVRE